jgi:hypothetical protein
MFNDIAAKKRMRVSCFFACDTTCPFGYATDGIWIFDHTGEQVVGSEATGKIDESLVKVGSES